MKAKNIKVIFDTNVWISFLIGKRLASIKEHISNGAIIIVITDQLLIEIKEVTSREKLIKYFPQESVIDLIELLETIAENVQTKQIHSICRDPKDNFLLDLIYFSKANFLVTGGKDLIELNPFKSTIILSPTDFEKILKNK